MVILILVVGQDDVLLRKLSDFERSIRPTREQTVVFVNQDLRHSLADVLEDSMASVLPGKRVVAPVTCQRPDL